MNSTKGNFPKVSEAVFGPNPEVILSKTAGRPSHFYYICILTLWVSSPLYLWLGAKGTWSTTLTTFIVDYVSHDPGNTILYADAMIWLPFILFLICLRALLYPRRVGGVCKWRWKK